MSATATTAAAATAATAPTAATFLPRSPQAAMAGGKIGVRKGSPMQARGLGEILKTIDARAILAERAAANAGPNTARPSSAGCCAVVWARLDVAVTGVRQALDADGVEHTSFTVVARDRGTGRASLVRRRYRQFAALYDAFAGQPMQHGLR